MAGQVQSKVGFKFPVHVWQVVPFRQLAQAGLQA